MYICTYVAHGSLGLHKAGLPWGAAQRSKKKLKKKKKKKQKQKKKNLKTKPNRKKKEIISSPKVAKTLNLKPQNSNK